MKAVFMKRRIELKCFSATQCWLRGKKGTGHPAPRPMDEGSVRQTRVSSDVKATVMLEE